MNSSENDRELIKNLEGLYACQLDADEAEAFKRCRKDGIARVVYDGVSGFMGLGKIRMESS